MARIVKKIVKKIKEVPVRAIKIWGRTLPDTIDNDIKFLKTLYKARLKTELNLEKPETFQEKLQWLKLYDRNPEYTVMVDKYDVKNYVAQKLGEEYIIPTLGIYDSFEEIDFDKLPNQFVLKCTHDSGGLIICKDKSKLNMEKAEKKIKRCLKRNYYYITKEWPYKNVKPRIIAEKYMVDESGNDLKDYKFFTFNGKARVMFIAGGRDSADGTYSQYFDIDFNPLDIKCGNRMADMKIEKPKSYDKMVEFAEKLAEGIPHARIDFYNDADGNIYFGEITFFHWSGLAKFEPDRWNKIFGDWITLPEKKN